MSTIKKAAAKYTTTMQERGPQAPVPTSNNVSISSAHVPHPRWPFFLNVTIANWFRTTVNPLVWELLAASEFPIPMQRAVSYSSAADSGIWLDAWRWSFAPFSDPSRNLEEKVRCRPDALLNPELMKDVFRLLTSGQKRESDRAKRILDLLATRHSGSEPSWSHPFPEKNPGIRDVTWGGALTRRQGRESLARVLRNELAVWRDAVEGGRRRGRPLTGEPKKSHPVTKSARAEYRNALAEYLTLLAANEPLRTAAGTLYKGSSMENGALALRTLSDAIEWLASDRVS